VRTIIQATSLPIDKVRQAGDGKWRFFQEQEERVKMAGVKTASEIYNDKLAEIYDRLHHFKNYGGEIEYLKACIKGRLPGAKTLLDVACGTGTHLGSLSSLYDVEGLDYSDAMLRRARDKHPEIKFHNGNMLEFDLGRRYDVVFCMFRSIAFVETRENLASTVGSMARHLRPGGLLLLEPFFTPQTYWVGDTKLNTLNEPDLKIAWMYVSEREGDVGVMRNHYLVGRVSGVEHFEEVHRMGLFNHEDYCSAFERANLDLEHDEAGPGKIGFYIGRLRT
jgi:ubiquinone/menaquinone biosynthesis C-methylase UbiE